MSSREVAVYCDAIGGLFAQRHKSVNRVQSGASSASVAIGRVAHVVDERTAA